MKYLMGLPFLCQGQGCDRCEDLYFEAGSWKLRHLVAVDDGFVFKKRSLVSPQSIDRAALAASRDSIPLTISKHALESAPAFEGQVPLSRAVELAALDHYRLSPYWISDSIEASSGMESGYPADDALPEEEDLPEVDPDLRSLKELLGYELRNGENVLGEVRDLVLDLSDFTVAYVAVDTKPSKRGGLRLIATGQEDVALSVDAASRCFRTKCSSYHLLESPSADLSEGRLTLGDQQKVDLSSY
ncbi:PRC-barrel domain-containing protein [Pelagicoccus sp. SDUM812005]|uniref:PRC-barrel domain-containing protein n=1 Tax=Pelagicoccus sp. SDUM812005 TaxID=3041257 RepID=UPI00280F1A37|nr:PRC-barrel domain-containing protein [Pelagicoccus sp. SDUM812005]MDQ8179117.1 PRC-barrel domain-containing protein [Pelagicoccus sp. SDUM812005]